jgi:tetratricopeptide (TPR) repeat protein
MGEYQKAIKAYESSLKCKPADTGMLSCVAYNNLGWTYNCIEEYDKAIEACKKAIQLKPKLAKPFNHLGFAYYKTGGVQKGIMFIKKSIRLDPNYNRAYSNLGRIYYELEQYEDAYDVCYRCLKIDVQFKEGLSLLKDLITNPHLIALSLRNTLNAKDKSYSNRFLTFLRWLRKKNLK